MLLVDIVICFRRTLIRYWRASPTAREVFNVYIATHWGRPCWSLLRYVSVGIIFCYLITVVTLIIALVISLIIIQILMDYSSSGEVREWQG